MKNQRTAVKKGIGLIVLLLLFSTFNPTLFSQTKNVGIGTENPNSSALLDLDVSNNTEFPTKKGLLIPRVALTGTTDITTIPSPETSLLIYNTATAGTSPNNVVPGFYYWSGSAWVKLTTISDESKYLQLAGGSMTGPINMNNNIIQNIGNAGTDFTASGGLNLADAVSATRFTSTVATGTSPFTIASNTLVTNLNADLLDGNDASAFANSSHTHSLLTRGNGLTGNNYDGSAATTWAVDFGAGANQASAGNHTHTGVYEKALTFILPLFRMGDNISIHSNSSAYAGYVAATAGQTNKVWKTDGTGEPSWANDANTTYTAGTGLFLSVENEFTANNTTALWNANQLQGKNISTSSPFNEQVLRWNNTANEWQPTTIASGGTVTSVALEVPTNEFNITGSPVTDDGTISITWKEQTPKSFLAAPWNTSGTPQFRTLTAEYIPELSTDKLTSGTLPVARGGTGAATLTGMLKGDGTNAFTGVTAGSRQLAFWSDANTIAGNDSIKWAEGTFSITGDLAVSGEIDPKALILIPQTTAPTATAGKLYFDDNTDSLKVYNGTTWVTLGSGGSGGGLPSGSENQTLRYGTSGWVASNTLINNGTKVVVGTNAADTTLQVLGIAHFTSHARIGENLLVGGSLSYTPLTVNTTPINPAGKTYIKVDLTGTFTLSNGTSIGQVIILQKISSGTATLEDSGNCKITGNWAGNENFTIQLIWDGSAWVEIGRSLN